MAETGKFKHTVQGETSEEREQASREAFEREVKVSPCWTCEMKNDVFLADGAIVLPVASV